MTLSGTHHGTHTGEPFTFTGPCEHGHDITWTAHETHDTPDDCPDWHTAPPEVAAVSRTAWRRLLNLLRGH